jgi:hypothetical protein
MRGLDSNDSGKAVMNVVLSYRDWSQMDCGSILSIGYEFVSSPASGQALGPNSTSNSMGTGVYPR